MHVAESSTSRSDLQIFSGIDLTNDHIVDNDSKIVSLTFVLQSLSMPKTCENLLAANTYKGWQTTKISCRSSDHFMGRIR